MELQGYSLSVKSWWCDYWWRDLEFHGYSVQDPSLSRFRSVVVITFASHAKGPRFDTGRKHASFFFSPPRGLPSHWQNQQARKARGEAGDAARGRVGDHLEVSLFSARSPGATSDIWRWTDSLITRHSSPSLTTKKTEVHKESKTWARQHAALQLDQEGPSPLLCVLAPEQKRRPGKET